MFVRKTRLPAEIEVQYIRINKLLKPEVKSKIKRIANSLVPIAIRSNFSSLHKLLISKTREAFPKTSQADLQVLTFQAMCEIIQAIRETLRSQSVAVTELVRNTLALLREVAQRQDANVRAIAAQ